jgi:hypothetical protein
MSILRNTLLSLLLAGPLAGCVYEQPGPGYGYGYGYSYDPGYYYAPPPSYSFNFGYYDRGYGGWRHHRHWGDRD